MGKSYCKGVHHSLFLLSLSLSLSLSNPLPPTPVSQLALFSGCQQHQGAGLDELDAVQGQS